MELPTVEAERLQRWLGTEPGVRQPKRRCERATRSRTVCRTLRRMYYVSASDMWVQELSFARHGFEMFHDMCKGSSNEDQIRNSSAGIRGWAQFGKGLLVPSEKCKQSLTTPSAGADRAAETHEVIELCPTDNQPSQVDHGISDGG